MEVGTTWGQGEEMVQIGDMGRDGDGAGAKTCVGERGW